MIILALLLAAAEPTPVSTPPACSIVIPCEYLKNIAPEVADQRLFELMRMGQPGCPLRFECGGAPTAELK